MPIQRRTVVGRLRIGVDDQCTIEITTGQELRSLVVEDVRLAQKLLASVPAAGGGAWFYDDDVQADVELSDDGRRITRVFRIHVSRGAKAFLVALD